MTYKRNLPIFHARKSNILSKKHGKEYLIKQIVETSLQNSMARHKHFLETISDGVLSIDASGILTEINQAGAEMLGHHKPEDIIGQSAASFWNSPEERNTFIAILKREKKLTSHRICLKRKDGEELELEVTGRIREDVTGSFLGIDGILRDVTDRVRAENEFKKKHDELNRLFRLVEKIKKEWEATMDCVADIIVLTDTEGKIKRCNRTLKEFAGKPYEEILNRDLITLLCEHGFAADRISGQDIEIYYRPSDRWFILHSDPFKEQESISGNVIIIHDITELKNAGRELSLKNQELEKAYDLLKDSQAKILHQEKMASIGQLAAGVAHEINNPVGFINSNLGTLQKYVGRLREFIETQETVIASIQDGQKEQEGLKTKRKQLKIDHILPDIEELIIESMDGTDRVKKIVLDLRNFAHTDEATSAIANINACLESTINIIWNELKYKVKLKKEYGDIPQIVCNVSQLNQVFMNLLINSAQAIDNKGEITVKTWFDNGIILVSISDTGKGIAADMINRIFDPFFTTKKVGEGTGLGLSIVYDIVKKHKGEIEVESEVGKGTIFTVKIPVEDKY